MLIATMAITVLMASAGPAGAAPATVDPAASAGVVATQVSPEGKHKSDRCRDKDHDWQCVRYPGDGGHHVIVPLPPIGDGYVSAPPGEAVTPSWGGYVSAAPGEAVPPVGGGYVSSPPGVALPPVG